MRIDRFRIVIFILLPVLWCTLPLYGVNTAAIPGDIHQICTYTNFFHTYPNFFDKNPSEDFFYHLNDRLLFMEKPDGKILGNGLRNRLLNIVRRHKEIKKSLQHQRVAQDKNNRITIDVATPDGYKRASTILNLLGLRLTKSPGDQYHVARNPASGSIDYFHFTLLKSKTIEQQLNKTHQLHLELKESEIPIPWDYGFLREITRLKIDAASFFETMVKNEQFSLLLGVLYRLSDKEIDHISKLVKSPRFGAWKKIYNDKKFLMGMFILSDGLRVTKNGQWALPGGKPAEAFWCQLAEKDHKKSPLSSLEFLHSLATKDEGKLNYLYLFSTFLPPEAQKALFTGINAQKFQGIYHLISLTKKEKLKETQFPEIKDSNFYTLLYSLRMKDNAFQFPHGADHWLRVIKRSDEEDYKEPEIKSNDLAITEKPSVFTRKLKKKYLVGKRKGFYLKISSGANFFDGGDFNTMIDSNVTFYKNLNAPINKTPFFWSLGGEFGYSVGRFSFGIETGYIVKSFTIKSHLGHQYHSQGHYTRCFSAFPVLLNIHSKVLDTSSLRADILVGGGIYFAEYKVDMEFVSLQFPIPYSNIPRYAFFSEKCKEKSYGFHVGTSLDFFVLKKLAFFLEARYRFVNFTDIYGKGKLVALVSSIDLDYEGELNVATSGETGKTEIEIGFSCFAASSDI